MSRFPRMAPGASALVQTRDAAAPTLLADALELTKPRITRLVTITAGVGFFLAALERAWSPMELIVVALMCVVGTAFSSAGANALNQWMERVRDGAMPRTENRPLPANRLPAWAGLAIGAGCSVFGIVVLWVFTTPAAAMVSLATMASYLLIYTPLKPVTPTATLIGAIPGALPPLIGWSATATGEGWRSLLHPGGWSIFLIIFVWQIPHFLAIAWRYRKDYARGGYKVLPVTDPSGRRTATAMLLWAATLIPVSLAPVHVLPALFGETRWLYALIALAAGGAFAWTTVRFARSRSDEDARLVFIASVIYLPVVMAALVGDAALAAIL